MQHQPNEDCFKEKTVRFDDQRFISKALIIESAVFMGSFKSELCSAA